MCDGCNIINKCPALFQQLEQAVHLFLVTSKKTFDETTGVTPAVMSPTKHGIVATLSCFLLAFVLLIIPSNADSACDRDSGDIEETTKMAELKPTVKELLSNSSSKITDFLSGIYEHSPWVAEGLVANADIASIVTVTELAAAMKAVVEEAEREKKLNLLLSHPDLCEKVGKMESLTIESQEEQASAGLQSLTAVELERFTSTNTAYKDKFGFPFILAVR